MLDLAGAVELVNQKTAAAGEVLGGRTKVVGKVEGRLVDLVLLELERHPAALGKESRAVESRPSREEKDERP